LELIPYAVLALVLVLVGALYITVFYGTHAAFKRLPVPKAIRPAIGAGLAGVLAVSLYMMLGEERHLLATLSTGYHTLQAALAPGGDAPGAAGLSTGSGCCSPSRWSRFSRRRSRSVPADRAASLDPPW
jgi:H+/Cl- antiporter ClcA